MLKLVRLTLIVAFCSVVLLMGSVGAHVPQTRDLAALQATATPTEGPCDPSDPIQQGWQLYMSDRPLVTGDSPPEEPAPREVFETGTRQVYAIFRTPCSELWPELVTVSLQIRDDRGGIQFESGPMTVRRNRWRSVGWSVPEGRSIPSGGSPYVTKLFRLDQSQATHAAEVSWVVGVSVRFDRDAYTGEDGVAQLTVIDYGADPDQETVTAHVSSQTDPNPGGLDVFLFRRGARGRFETVDGITFDDDCTGGSSGTTLCVTHQDELLIEYQTGGETFTDEARWYRANFTPTPTWPPSPTLGPPTLTPTPGPSPTATPVTPSPTPTPTEFPWATIVPLTVVPGQYDVGSVSSDLPGKNLLGSYAIWAGSHNTGGRQKLYGAIHFDLSSIPADAEITEAWLDLVPFSGSNMHPELGGQWTLQIFDGAVENPWTGGGQPYYPTYRVLVEEPVSVVPAGTPASPNDLADDLRNNNRTRFAFSEEALDHLETRLSTGEIALRLDGPLMDQFQSFTWYSGYAPNTPEKRPVLHLEYKVFGATWTPSPTSPFTATPSQTPTPTGTLEPTATRTATPASAITFDRPVYYGDAAAIIEVVDPGRNADPSTAETIDIHVRSATESAIPGLKISLLETNSNSGRFTGALYFSTEGSDAGERRIHVSDGDWIQATAPGISERAEASWYAEAPTATPTGTATSTPTRTATPTLTPTSTVTLTPTPPAWVAFDRDHYWDTDEAELTVLDPNANEDPELREEVPVYVSSETDSRGITVFVKETDNAGIFSSDAAAHNLHFCWLCQESNEAEGMLKVSDGDELTAYYSDPMHPDCCWDTAQWHLSQSGASPTPTSTPSPTATPTPTPTLTPTTSVKHHVYLPAVMRQSQQLTRISARVDALHMFGLR